MSADDMNTLVVGVFVLMVLVSLGFIVAELFHLLH